jgi:hypothetical protein
MLMTLSGNLSQMCGFQELLISLLQQKAKAINRKSPAIRADFFTLCSIPSPPD